MKKVLKTLAAVAVLAAVGFFGYRYYLSRQAVATQAPAGSTYTEYPISTGSLSKTVTGTGTLSISQTDDVALDYAVTVTDSLVEAGDTVTAGQPLSSIDAIAPGVRLKCSQSSFLVALLYFIQDRLVRRAEVVAVDLVRRCPAQVVVL